MKIVIIALASMVLMACQSTGKVATTCTPNKFNMETCSPPPATKVVCRNVVVQYKNSQREAGSELAESTHRVCWENQPTEASEEPTRHKNSER